MSMEAAHEQAADRSKLLAGVTSRRSSGHVLADAPTHQRFPPDAGCSRNTLADQRPCPQQGSGLARSARPCCSAAALPDGVHHTPLPRRDHPMIGNSSRKDETLERLTNGIAQLTSSDSWRAWLKAQARFHRYSFSNTILILCQRPTASRVAGFHTWRRLGRVVRRGESALWIFAPVTRRVASVDDTEQSTRLVAAFRPVPVFDISQTEGDPLPEICTRLSGDDPLGAYARLVHVASDIDFT